VERRRQRQMCIRDSSNTIEFWSCWSSIKLGNAQEMERFSY
jgi:hypothetical protein